MSLRLVINNQYRTKNGLAMDLKNLVAKRHIFRIRKLTKVNLIHSIQWVGANIILK